MFHDFDDLLMKNGDFPWFFVCLPYRVSHHHPIPVLGSSLVRRVKPPRVGRKWRLRAGRERHGQYTTQPWQNLLMCKYPLAYLLYYTSIVFNVVFVIIYIYISERTVCSCCHHHMSCQLCQPLTHSRGRQLCFFCGMSLHAPFGSQLGCTAETTAIDLFGSSRIPVNAVNHETYEDSGSEKLATNGNNRKILDIRRVKSHS